MRYSILVFLCFLSACVDSKTGFIEIKSRPHHHLALQAIKSAIPPADYFEVHQWYGPDTLSRWPDTAVRMPIRYQLDFDFREKRRQISKKRGTIVFNGATDTILLADMVDRL